MKMEQRVPMSAFRHRGITPLSPKKKNTTEYRDADKSLVPPGRKQANVFVRMA